MFWIKSQATNSFYEFLFILIKINLKYNFFSEDLKIDTWNFRKLNRFWLVGFGNLENSDQARIEWVLLEIFSGVSLNRPS